MRIGIWDPKPWANRCFTLTKRCRPTCCPRRDILVAWRQRLRIKERQWLLAKLEISTIAELSLLVEPRMRPTLRDASASSLSAVSGFRPVYLVRATYCDNPMPLAPALLPCKQRGLPAPVRVRCVLP